MKQDQCSSLGHSQDSDISGSIGLEDHLAIRTCSTRQVFLQDLCM